MKIIFTKMHGNGNDYIYINCLDGINFEPADLAIKMSLRHFSVGSDGIILLLKSELADAKMRIFNADGSEAEMCGNGIRCFAAFAVNQGLLPIMHDSLTVETSSGIHRVNLYRNSSGDIVSASVVLKTPELIREIPEKFGTTIKICNRDFRYYPISVGNPHCVIFVDDINQIDITQMHRELVALDIFREGVNLEAVCVKGSNLIEMSVYERGSGITLSCGTGACASAFASILAGVCKIDEAIRIETSGGALSCIFKGRESLVLEGPVQTVFNGIYEYDPN